MTRQIKGLCGAIMLVLAGHAWADTTWTLNTGTVSGDNSSATANSTGWANTGTQISGGTTPDTFKLEQQIDTGSTTTTNFWLYGSNGLGINNKDGCSSGSNCDVGDVWSVAPEHAIDNEQRYEMVLVSFNKDVKVSGVSFGYIGTDSDYTILAYNGPTLPGANAAAQQTALMTQLATQTWGGLTGWQAIGNYANAPINTVLSTNANVFSSYWLIGAYNPLAGGNAGFTAGQYDYLKLKTVVGAVKPATVTQATEPGSLALIGLALVGMLYTRHRRWAGVSA